MFSRIDKKIISLISQDIPLSLEPFKDLADRIGIKEEEFLSRVKSYKERGILRKFCASLNHRKAGFKYNAMAVWNVPGQSVNKAGLIMSSLAQVSHCYQRKKTPDWNYNLYSMIHGRTKEECFKVVKDISGQIYCKDYQVLFSTREYKKSGVNYGEI